MSEKTYENLIDDLSAELKPVKRLAHPAVRVLQWTAFAVVYALGCIAVIGVRPDFSAKLTQGIYLYELVLALGIALSAALASGFLAVPDLKGKAWIIAVPISLLAAFAVFVLAGIYSDGLHLPHLELHKCAGDAVLLGSMPVAALVFLSRRGATVMPKTMAAMNGLAVGAFGWACLRITCQADIAGHILLYHFLPYVLIGGLLGGLARRIYRW